MKFGLHQAITLCARATKQLCILPTSDCLITTVPPIKLIIMKRNTLSDQSSVSKKQCDILLHHICIILFSWYAELSVNETEMNPPRKQSPIDRIKSILKIKKKYSSPGGGYGGLPPGGGYGGLPPGGGYGGLPPGGGYGGLPPGGVGLRPGGGYGGLCPGGGVGLPPGGGVVSGHTLLSHVGDDRKMSGGGGGVGNDHTLLSHEGDDRKMPGGGMGNDHTLLSHEGDDRMMWTRGTTIRTVCHTLINPTMI